MPKVTIDGIEIEVPKGTTILEASRMIGPHVAPPAMCYYSKLKTTGGYCRTCIVKVTKGSAQNPNPMPKPVASCRTEVMDGMVVENNTNAEVIEARNGVVEFLLINHPLDCPVCDQAGECKLQDLGFSHGSAKTRYEFRRREYEMIDIGDKIKLHMNRCILCYRCVKLAEQLTPKRVHGVMHRGDASEISTYIQNVVTNEFSGNVIDVCPVGALTDRTFRFKQRVWFTKPMDAHRDCDKCHGRVRLWLKGEDVIRVTSRINQWYEVIDTPEGKPGYICNSCRYDHKKKKDWTIEGPSPIHRTSVISQNHYQHLNELKVLAMKQQEALGFMDIHKKP
jgi:NADH-quinone oxidoreductase subunit G